MSGRSQQLPALPDFRAMTMEDLAEVLRNETRAYAFPWTPGLFADAISGRDLCNVLVRRDEILGHSVVSHGAGEAHLLNICIARDHQGQGLGGALLEFVLMDLDERGVSTVFLEVRPSNKSAIRLYQAVGFRDIGRRPGYYPAAVGHEDARVMALDIG